MKKSNNYFKMTLCAIFVIFFSVMLISVVFFYPAFMATVKRCIKILNPLIYGFALAYIIRPLVFWFERSLTNLLPSLKKDKKFTRFLAMTAAYSFLILLLAAFFYYIMPRIANSLIGIIAMSPVYAANITSWLTSLYDEFRYFGFAGFNEQQILMYAESFLADFNSWLTKMLPKFLTATLGIMSFAVNLIVSIVVSVYFVSNTETFRGQYKKLLYSLFKPKKVNAVLSVIRDCDRIFEGFISGKLLDSLIIAILCFVGMTLLKLPEKELITVIVGTTNVIPYFGPFIGGIPSVMLMLLINPGQAFVLAVFIVALQQFDGNILGPKILGNSTGISAFWVIFSVTVFGGFFGVPGMFFGVPVFAVIYKLTTDFVHLRLRNKNYPIETSKYSDPTYIIEDSESV